MGLSVEQLITPLKKEQALATILDMLVDLGFPAKSWQSGSLARSLIEIWAAIDANRSQAIPDIAKSGFNPLATGAWLHLLAESHFDNTPLPGSCTIGMLVMTASESAGGPYTIDTGVNQQIFADSVYGYTYRNITGGTLTAGGSLTVTIQAEQIGAQADVASNTITVQKTPLAGVTVNNPDYVDPGLGALGTWITENGAFAESDDKLRLRNATKWATLTTIPPRDAYIHFALKAHESVTRASLDDKNPRGPGTLDVYIAGVNGALSGGVVSVVSDFIAGVTDGKGRVPPGGDVLVKAAVNTAVPITGTVFIERSFNTASNRAAIETALRMYFQSLPVGGTIVTLGAQGVIVYAQLLRIVLSAAPGVTNVIFTSPTTSIVLATGQVAVPTINLTYSAV